MTDTSIAQTAPVLVAIDIAKARHEVLIAIPGRKRRRRLSVLNQLEDFNRLVAILSEYGHPVREAFEATGTPSSPCFKTNAFCASENFDAFITFAPFSSQEIKAENSSFRRSSFQGAEHSVGIGRVLLLGVGENQISSHWITEALTSRTCSSWYLAMALRYACFNSKLGAAEFQSDPPPTALMSHFI